MTHSPNDFQEKIYDIVEAAIFHGYSNAEIKEMLNKIIDRVQNREMEKVKQEKRIKRDKFALFTMVGMSLIIALIPFVIYW